MNKSLFGTLSAGMTVHPSVQHSFHSEVHTAVDRLKYGLVAVNTGSFLASAITAVPWGAWNQAGTPEDIGSGNVLEMTSMYDHAEKAVVWMPFMMQPKALWHPQHTNMEAGVNAMVKYTANRGPVSLTKLIANVMGSK